MSYGTIEHLQRELHPAFEMAVRDCLIRTNPTPQILGQLKQQTKVKRSIRKALTPEQQKHSYNLWMDIQYMITGNHFLPL